MIGRNKEIGDIIDYLDRVQMDTSDEDTDKGRAMKIVQRRRRRRKTTTGAEPAHAMEELAAPMEYHGQIKVAAAAGGVPKFEGGEVMGGVAGEPP